MMEINLNINGKSIKTHIKPSDTLFTVLREQGFKSVKCGCDTGNCGACTVLLDGKPILSCSLLAVRAEGYLIETLEGLTEKANEFIGFIADEGADQCGYCNPGFVVNLISLFAINDDPTDEEIKAYLSGNLCRCSGYEGQLRGVRKFLDAKHNRL